MKTKLICITTIALVAIAASCRKPKNEPPVEEPIKEEPAELITTFKLVFTDSASKAQSTYLFKDPDGEGGLPAFYGPGTSTASTQADSVITLYANKVYNVEVILLDETKNPVTIISDEVNEEGKDHMLFYNNGKATILNSGNPYTVKLASDVIITYQDLDTGSPQRGIGLKTKWRTNVASPKQSLNISLRHQPDTKNGTYGPGETDIAVDFKLRIE